MSVAEDTMKSPARTGARAGCMTVLGLLAILLKSTDTGFEGMVVGLVLAALPVPIYVSLALWLDRFEPEPPRLLWWAFFWGATVANFAALLLNTAAGLVVAASVGEAGGELFSTVISAPFVEETAKGFLVYLIYRLCRDEFDNVVDGIIYASMVALGFAMVENAGYYGVSLREGGVAQLNITLFVRGIMSPFAHPLFTSMTGIGLGLARQTTRPWVRRTAPIAGLMLAMMLHALWNSVDGEKYITLYFLVMVPTFFGVLILVARSLRGESELIRTCLEAESVSGVLSANDCPDLTTIAARRRSLWRSLRNRGIGGWRGERRRQRAASELAFYRDRVARGVVPADPAVEAALLEQLRPGRADGPAA